MARPRRVGPTGLCAVELRIRRWLPRVPALIRLRLFVRAPIGGEVGPVRASMRARLRRPVLRV